MRKLLEIILVAVILILLGICYRLGFAVSENMHMNPIKIKRIYLPEGITGYKPGDSLEGVMHGDTVIIDFYYPSRPFTSAK